MGEKMKSSDWLILPIYRNVWPESVYRNAKKCGILPEEIVLHERDSGIKVEPGRTIMKAVPFDMLDLIIDVEQSEEDKNMTIVMFGDEDETAILVRWPIRKFIKILDEFMQGSPKYRSIPEATQTITWQTIPYSPGPNSKDDSEE